MTERTTVVWTEIPVNNLENACKFYAHVFEWTMEINDMEPNKVADFNASQASISGHLYEGSPSKEGTGSTIHFAVPDTLEATMKRCEHAGGKVVSPIIEIPPGRFVYALDPDGNSIGIFEGKAK